MCYEYYYCSCPTITWYCVCYKCLMCYCSFTVGTTYNEECSKLWCKYYQYLFNICPGKESECLDRLLSIWIDATSIMYHLGSMYQSIYSTIYHVLSLHPSIYHLTDLIMNILWDLAVLTIIKSWNPQLNRLYSCSTTGHVNCSLFYDFCFEVTIILM